MAGTGALAWQMPECGPNVPDGDTHRHTNQLIVSMLRAFGFDDQTFGDPRYRGPLANLP